MFFSFINFASNSDDMLLIRHNDNQFVDEYRDGYPYIWDASTKEASQFLLSTVSDYEIEIERIQNKLRATEIKLCTFKELIHALPEVPTESPQLSKFSKTGNEQSHRQRRV